jgi:hypothetical protein
VRYVAVYEAFRLEVDFSAVANKTLKQLSGYFNTENIMTLPKTY